MDDVAAHEDQDAVVGGAPVEETMMPADVLVPLTHDAAAEPTGADAATVAPYPGPGEAPVQDRAPVAERLQGAEPETLSLDELVAELSDETVSEPVESAEGRAEPAASEVTAAGEAAEEYLFSPHEPVVPAGPVPITSRIGTRAPFWLLGVAWAGFVGVMAFVLWPASSGAFVTSPLYPTLVFGGAALVLLGFVTGLVVWVAAWFAAGRGGRAGVFRIVWMRALGWTAGGVALWWIALVALDMHRSGIIR